MTSIIRGHRGISTDMDLTLIGGDVMQLTTKVYDGLQQVLDDLPIPMIIGKSLPGSEGMPSDFEYLSINKAYEQKSGIKMDAMIGKRLHEVYPHLEKDPFERAEFIAEVAYGDKEEDELSFFSPSWNGWIQLKVIKLGNGRFVAIYIDTSQLKYYLDKLTKIISSIGIIISKGIKDIDYQHITDTLAELTGAKLVVFNLLDDEGQKSSTVAISSDADMIRMGEDTFGGTLIGKTWIESDSTKKAFGASLSKMYHKLSDITKTEQLKRNLETLEAQIGFGATIIAKINAGEKIFGYFLFIMPEGIPYKSQSIVDIYTRFVGLAIAIKNNEIRIKEEKVRFKALFENMGSGANILEVKNSGQRAEDYVIKEMNKMGLKINNVARKDVIGRTMRELNEDFDRTGLIRRLKEVWETGKDTYTIINIKSHDRQIKWYESRSFRLADNELVTMYNDVTERIAAEQALAKSENFLKKLIDNMEQGLAVFEPLFDVSGVLVDIRPVMINPSFTNLMQLNSGEILEEAFKDVMVRMNLHWFERFNQVFTTGESCDFDEHSNILGKYFNVVAYQPFNGVITVILTDITEQKQVHEQLRIRSDQDSLTGLFNRRYFDEELARQDYSRNYPLTLVLADIDDLKMINDVHGHQVGDKAIQQIAALMQAVCPEDCIIARTGGDEFTLLLIGQDEVQADGLIRKIKQTTAEKISVSGKSISVSMGFATKKKPLQRMGDIFRQAENMMYKNKIMWNRSSIGSIEMIMQALREKNERERIHADQVALICEEIGKEMSLSDDSLKELIIAALLHDIGKIGVSEQILDKPDKLTEEEYAIVKKHCESGYKILAPIPELESVAITVLTHHERFDGKGYPNNIAGAKIPLHARIICVADSFSAMISKRPYREEFSFEIAKQEIMDCSGKQFDPVIVDAFMNRFTLICSKIHGI